MHDVLILHALILDHDFVYCCWNHHHHSVLKNWLAKYVSARHAALGTVSIFLSDNTGHTGSHVWLAVVDVVQRMSWRSNILHIFGHNWSTLYFFALWGPGLATNCRIFWRVSQSGNIEEIQWCLDLVTLVRHRKNRENTLNRDSALNRIIPI